MSYRTTYLLTAGVGLLTAVLVSACSGASPGGPAVTTPARSSSAPTATVAQSPTTTAPPDVKTPSAATTAQYGAGLKAPSAALAHSTSGAEEFTKFFFRQVNLAYASARADAIRPLTLPGCKSCAGFVEAIEGLAAAGHHYVGDFTTPELITIATFDKTEAKTFVSTRTAAHTIVDASGATVESIPSDHFSLSVFLTWNGKWQVVELKAVA